MTKHSIHLQNGNRDTEVEDKHTGHQEGERRWNELGDWD